MAIDFNAPSQVRPYANLGAFPATGAVKTIYIAEDTNYIYRWNGTAYIEISVADLVGYVPYTGATQDVNLGNYDAYVNKLWLYDSVNDNYGSVHFTDTDFHIEDADGHKMLVLEDGFMQIHKTDTIQSNLYTSGLTATRDHYLPNASGTIALTSDIPSLAGYVPTTRTITTTSPLSGGGDLSANRTLAIAKATTLVDGYLSATDWTTFNGKQSALVSGTNIKTINSTSLLGSGDVAVQPTLVSGTNIKTVNGTTILGSGDLTISTGITIGTTAITSGTVGRVLFQGSGNVVQQSSSLFWDSTNNRLGIGTSSPTSAMQIVGSTNVEGLLNITNNTALNYANALNILFPNTTTNNQVAGFYIGKALSTKNGWGVSYIHSADGSNSNRGSIAFYGVDNILNWFASGNVAINTTTDAGYKLDVNGTARVQSTLTVSGQTGSGGVNSIISTNNDLSLACGYYFRFRATNDSNAIILGSDWDGTQTYLYSNRRMVFGAATMNASAILQTDSTTRGFLPPRMTTTQKNAIASPVAGLMVYDTTLNLMALYNGTTWTTL